MNRYTPPDYMEWATNLLREGQILWHTQGWDGVRLLLARALHQSFEQGYAKGSREGEDKGWKEAVDTYFQAETQTWEVASLTDLQEFLNDEEEKGKDKD